MLLEKSSCSIVIRSCHFSAEWDSWDYSGSGLWMMPMEINVDQNPRFDDMETQTVKSTDSTDSEQTLRTEFLETWIWKLNGTGYTIQLHTGL